MMEMFSYSYPLVNDRESSFAQMMPPPATPYPYSPTSSSVQPVSAQWSPEGNLYSLGAHLDSFPFTAPPSTEHTFTASYSASPRTQIQSRSQFTANFSGQISGSFITEFSAQPPVPAPEWLTAQQYMYNRYYRQRQEAPCNSLSPNSNASSNTCPQQWCNSVPVNYGSTQASNAYSKCSQLERQYSTQYSPSSQTPSYGSYPSAYLSHYNTYTSKLGAMAAGQQMNTFSQLGSIDQRDSLYKYENTGADLQFAGPSTHFESSMSLGVGCKRRWGVQSGAEFGSKLDASATLAHMAFSESSESSPISSDSGFRELTDEAAPPSKRVCDDLQDKQSRRGGKEESSTVCSTAAPEEGASMLAGRVARARGGPVQLWQYLLELLRDPARNAQIAWTTGGTHDWEFRLVEPDSVARAWGERKRKPRMNYEKLARGTLLAPLRYYYDKRIIRKSAGCRYSYYFVNADAVEALVGESEASLIARLGLHTVAPHDEDEEKHQQDTERVAPAVTMTPASDSTFLSLISPARSENQSDLLPVINQKEQQLQVPRAASFEPLLSIITSNSPISATDETHEEIDEEYDFGPSDLSALESPDLDLSALSAFLVVGSC